MQDNALSKLSQLLANDKSAGLQQFRHLFFENVNRRRFDDCRRLLESLRASPSAYSQHAYRHYRGVLLYFEQRKLDQAESIFRELLTEALSPIQRARTLLALAILLDEQAQWPEAERVYQQALAAYEHNHDDLGRSKVYNNMGISITFQVEQGVCDAGRLEEAIAYHQTAMKLAQDTDAWEVAKNQHGLAKAYGLMAQYGKALDVFETYLELCQEFEHEWDRGYALTDVAALVHLPQGQYAEAEAALEESVAILRRLNEYLNLAEALAYRGNLRVQQRRFEEALADYDQAIGRVESIRRRLTAPTAKVSNRATSDFIYAAPFSLHLQLGNAARAFDVAERARSRVLADLLAGQTAQPHSDLPGDLLELRRELRQKLDRAYAAAEAPSDLPSLEASLADIDRQIELLDPTYAALDTVDPLTAEEVQERLPANSALLTYAGDSDDRLWAIVITSDRVESIPIPHPPLRWLRDYLADHLDSARRGILVPEPHSGHLHLPQELFPPLYKILLDPVQALLEPVDTVYMAPVGPLHYLPLGALAPDLADAPPLLRPGRRIVYAPSATVLLDYCHRCAPSPHRSALALAPQEAGLQFIQGAAQAVARLGGGSAFLGTNATRRTFLAHAGSHRVVCFLGHAVFDRKHPMSSRLQLADGNLRASEMLRELRLQADLVILAACESGRGRVLRGGEILGLSRAMLYAGTPALLVTLWPVHEIPTRLLVEKFVAQIFSSRFPDVPFDPALALAAAQRWLRTLTYSTAQDLLTGWGELSISDVETRLIELWRMTHPDETPQDDSQLFSHPFFWSPFILIGEQRRE